MDGKDPVGRAGEPMDVAKVLLYLTSNDASFVPGFNFMVDGGLHTVTPILVSCLRQNYCQIDANTRSDCKRCRLEKCYAMGMKKVCIIFIAFLLLILFSLSLSLSPSLSLLTKGLDI